jgi:hypothetical protein
MRIGTGGPDRFEHFNELKCSAVKTLKCWIKMSYLNPIFEKIGQEFARINISIDDWPSKSNQPILKE